MDEFSESVMVALLPTITDWCKIKLPHLTLVYVGEIPDLSYSIKNEIAKEVVNISQDFQQLTVDVLALDVFGEEELVDVLLIRPVYSLLQMRARLEQWNGSQYTSFKPHCTIGPVGSADDELPTELTFDRILFSWGTENKEFKLS